MQNSEIIIPTLIISTLVGVILVIYIAYIFYCTNKRQLMLQNTYEKEVIKTQMEIQESTFMHVSQEIHDNIAQLIILAKFQLSSQGNSINQFQTMIKDVDDILTTTLTEIRSLSKNLNSHFVTENGLWHSIQNHVEHLNKNGSISVVMDEEGTAKKIDAHTEIMLFRIVQESITNILKHSKANKINIKFHFKQESLELCIEDNGIGFDVDKTLKNTYKSGSSGLQNIIRRANLIHASHNIISIKEKGTLLCITTPC